jgi:hypothetical protein
MTVKQSSRTYPAYLTQADELPHPIERTPLWSENYLSGAVFPAAGAAVWLHQSRVPEDPELWEEIFIIYLPGDRLLVAKGAALQRAQDGPGGAALTYRCLEPFAEWSKRFRGTARLITEADHLSSPMVDGPSTVVDMLLSWRAGTPAYDMDVSEQPWARTSSHYQQHMQVSGVIRFGEERLEVEGPGMRDHSWGPRHLSHLGTHIWSYGAFPSGRAFMLFYHVCADGSRLLNTANLYDDGALVPILLQGPPPLIERPEQAASAYTLSFARPDVTPLQVAAAPLRTSVMGFANHAELVIGGPHPGSSHAIYECPTRFICEDEVGYGFTERTVQFT